MQNRILKVGIISLSRIELTSMSGSGKQLAHGLGVFRHLLQLVEGMGGVGKNLTGLQGSIHYPLV